MLPIKPVFKMQNMRRDGTVKLYLQYCYTSEQRTLLETGIIILPKYWHKKRLCVLPDLPEQFGSAQALNENLKSQIRKAGDLVTLVLKKKCIDPLETVKEYYKPDLDLAEVDKLLDEVFNKKRNMNVKYNLDIYFQIDDYIKSKTRKSSKDMLRIYRNMKDHLKEFELFRNEPITFECLDINFYDAFIDFLTYDYVHKRRKKKIVGLKINTVGKTIKQFLTFLNDRVKKKIIPVINTEGWKILEEEVDAIYLNSDEIKKIYHADLKAYPHLEEYRNDFLLGCLTGLRFSDFSKLAPGDMRGNMLYKKQKKSRHWVVIPLLKEAKRILDEKFAKGLPPPTNQEFNRHVKNLGQIAGLNHPVTHSYVKGNKTIEEVKPKYAWICSHTCRRSFCTNEFLAGTPVELIMKISGHKSLKDFYKYIRISPEEAAVKVEAIWKGRDDHLK